MYQVHLLEFVAFCNERERESGSNCAESAQIGSFAESVYRCGLNETGRGFTERLLFFVHTVVPASFLYLWLYFKDDHKNVDILYFGRVVHCSVLQCRQKIPTLTK